MKTTNTLIGMAAALALSAGSVTFAQVDGRQPAGNTPTPNEAKDNANNVDRDRGNAAGRNDPADINANRGTTGQPGNHSGMAPGAAADGDRSVQSQLQMIESSPEQAPQKLFVLHQGMMNACEIEISDAVASKTQDPQVKQLAQMISKDHQEAQERLRPIAKKYNVSIPEQLPAMKQQEIAIMKQLPADKLDKMYLSMQKASHAAAMTSLNDCQHMFKESNDRELAGYVDQTLPGVKQHANRVVELAQTKGLGGDLVIVTSRDVANPESGTRAERGESTEPGTSSMPPKARDGAIRNQPGDRVTGEQRE